MPTLFLQFEGIEILACPLCHKVYLRRVPQNMSCAVVHAPGSCCHYLQIPVSDTFVDETIKRAKAEQPASKGGTDAE